MATACVFCGATEVGCSNCVSQTLSFPLAHRPEFYWASSSFALLSKVLAHLALSADVAFTHNGAMLSAFALAVVWQLLVLSTAAWIGYCHVSESFPLLWPIKVCTFGVATALQCDIAVNCQRSKLGEFENLNSYDCHFGHLAFVVCVAGPSNGVFVVQNSVLYTSVELHAAYLELWERINACMGPVWTDVLLWRSHHTHHSGTATTCVLRLLYHHRYNQSCLLFLK